MITLQKLPETPLFGWVQHSRHPMTISPPLENDSPSIPWTEQQKKEESSPDTKQRQT